MILIPALILASLFIAVQVYTLQALIFREPDFAEDTKDFPVVSVLLAVRNEAGNMERCLRALQAQNYPKERMEILIGDDQSTDDTVLETRAFIEGKDEFRLYHIEENLGLARGKGNVLAHLAHRARGDFFLVTDADVQVPPNWIRGMLSAFKAQTGIVSGTSMCERGKPLAMMQAIDWMHFMGYIKAFANAGLSCTAVGNNMAVRREAYFQTGGFEALAFSITEDYKLFQAVRAQGWDWATQLNRDTLGIALPIKNYSGLLQQRKRWLIGASDLTPIWKALFLLYGSFTPVLLLLFIYEPRAALLIFGLKFVLQITFLTVLTHRLGIKPFRLFQLLGYELFVQANTFVTAVYYLLPIPTVWRGRRYRNHDLC